MTRLIDTPSLLIVMLLSSTLLVSQTQISDVPVTVSQSGTSLVQLAAINVASLALLAIIARWADARKDRANAKATNDAAILAADLRAKEKAMDWARQDEVAKQVKEAATATADASRVLVEATASAARHQDEVSARIHEQLIAIDEQGKKIHILVNSDMTAARTSERDSLRLLVIALRNSMAQSVKMGLTVRQSELDEIARVDTRVAELDQILSDRHKAQLIVDAEAKASIATASTIATEASNVTQKATQSALKEIVKNTAETAQNTAKE